MCSSDLGTTVFFVSHNTAQIQEMCNKVLWLEHGEVQMMGTSDEVIREYTNYLEGI